MSDKINWSDFRLDANRQTNASCATAEKVQPYSILKSKHFFRVHKDEAYHIVLGLIEDKTSRGGRLFFPKIELEPELQNDLKLKSLFLSQTVDGLVFLLPVRAVKEGESLDSWSDSAHFAVDLAKDSWIRLQPNIANAMYDIYRAKDLDLEPTWPTHSMNEILDTAFRGYIIDTQDHPILKKLRGEI